MRICGVDPGGTGALALLTEGGLRVEVADMPVFRVSRGRGSKATLDVHGLIDLLARWQADVCFFEQVWGRDGDSASSAFNFGHITGAAEALIKAGGAQFHQVPPHRWKKKMGLIRTAKDDSRALATSLWPRSASDFRLKKHDGRAEAALLAEYGRRQLTVNEGVFG